MDNKLEIEDKPAGASDADIAELEGKLREVHAIMTRLNAKHVVAQTPPPKTSIVVSRVE
jgi:hypothetical protein